MDQHKKKNTGRKISHGWIRDFSNYEKEKDLAYFRAFRLNNLSREIFL